MNKYEDAARIIIQNKEEYDVSFKKALKDNVLNVETQLGVMLPEDYRKFLQQFGYLEFKGLEVAGVVSVNPESQDYGSILWLTLSERRDNHMPHKYVIISDSGMGEWYVLDTINGRVDLIDNVDFQVVLGEPDESYDSFSDFLYKKVKEYDEMD